MPLLGGLFTTLFSGFAGWLAQWFTRKVAFGLAAVATMTGLTAALFVLMRATLAATASMQNGAPAIFMQALQMAIPPIAPACISTYVTVWTACTVYTWQKDLIHLFAKAG
jgi:dipeptide/tripeptide permease